ncbi:39298_t:CDS:1, partial [Gigaspora margarita]
SHAGIVYGDVLSVISAYPIHHNPGYRTQPFYIIEVAFRIRTEECSPSYDGGHDALSILFDFTPSGSVPSDTR